MIRMKFRCRVHSDSVQIWRRENFDTLSGRIDIEVWAVNGRRVGTLPSIEADRAGTYSVELDLEGMLPGSYLVRAHAVEAMRSVTAQLTVVE